jgi:LysR family hydrogen peroxide-inducible transcriptional activator
MELHQLRYFCAVAKTANFTRAAQSERVAQPSLSQQIMKLEDELGARLFDRLGRTVRLTEFGRILLPRAEAILRQLGEAKTEIQQMAGIDKGRVVLGAIPTIAPYFLPGRLAGFARRHPAIAISVVEETTPMLLQRLREASADLALLALPVAGDEFACEELLRERLYVVVAENHRFASRAAIELKAIADEPFLLLKEGHCFRDNTIAACRRARVHPNVVFETGQFDSILAMVAAGMGVSIVPEMAASRRSRCRFLRVEDSRAYRTIGLVRFKHHFPTRAERVLAEHLRGALKTGKNAPG